MKTWDLSGGAARLEECLDTLKAHWVDTTTSWDDATSRQFLKDHLEPMEPKFRIALGAVRRMAAVLSQAERECSDT